MLSAGVNELAERSLARTHEQRCVLGGALLGHQLIFMGPPGL